MSFALAKSSPRHFFARAFYENAPAALIRAMSSAQTNKITETFKARMKEVVELFDMNRPEAFVILEQMMNDEERFSCSTFLISSLSNIVLSSKSTEPFWLLSCYFFVIFPHADMDEIKQHLDKIGTARTQKLTRYTQGFVDNYKEQAFRLFAALCNIRQTAVDERNDNGFNLLHQLTCSILQDALHENNPIEINSPYIWDRRELAPLKFETIKRNGILKNKIRKSGLGCHALNVCLLNCKSSYDGIELEKICREIFSLVEPDMHSPQMNARDGRSSRLSSAASITPPKPRGLSKSDLGAMDSKKVKKRSFIHSRADIEEEDEEGAENEGRHHDMEEEQDEADGNFAKSPPISAMTSRPKRISSRLSVASAKSIFSDRQSESSGANSFANARHETESIWAIDGEDEDNSGSASSENDAARFIEYAYAVLKRRKFFAKRERPSWLNVFNKMIKCCFEDGDARRHYVLAVEIILRSYEINVLKAEKKKANVLNMVLESSHRIEDIFVEFESPVVFEAVQYLESPSTDYKKLTRATMMFAVRQPGYLNDHKTETRVYSRKTLGKVKIDPVKLFGYDTDADSLILPFELAFEVKSWRHVARASQINISLPMKDVKLEFEEKLRELVRTNNPTRLHQWQDAIRIFSEPSTKATSQATLIAVELCENITYHHYSTLISMEEFEILQDKYPGIRNILIKVFAICVDPFNQNGSIPLFFIEFMRKLKFDTRKNPPSPELKEVLERVHEYFKTIKAGDAHFEVVLNWMGYKPFFLDVSRALGLDISGDNFSKTLNDCTQDFFQSKLLIQELLKARNYFFDEDRPAHLIYQVANPWDVSYHATTAKEMKDNLNKFKFDLGYLDGFKGNLNSFRYFIENESLIFFGALKLIKWEGKINHAEHIQRTIDLLQSMMTATGFKLNDIRVIRGILLDIDKSLIDKEIETIEVFFLGARSKGSKANIMTAGMDLLIYRSYMPDMIKFHKRIAESIPGTLASDRFRELAIYLEGWSNQSDDPSFGEVMNLINGLLERLPNISVHVVPIYPLLLDADYLFDVLFNKFGKNEDDFQRKLALLKGNFQDDASAMAILSSLHQPRSLLSKVYVEVMTDSEIEELTPDKICENIKMYLVDDPKLNSLQESIRHADDVKSYLDQLKNNDVQLSIVTIKSHEGECIVTYVGGQEMAIDDVIQRVNFSLFSVKLSTSEGNAAGEDATKERLTWKRDLLLLCRDGHQVWSKLMETSYPAPSPTRFLFTAHGYDPNHRKEVLGRDATDDQRKYAAEKERLSSRWYMMTNLSLEKFMRIRQEEIVEFNDTIMDAVVECMQPITKEEAMPYLKLDKIAALKTKSGQNILLSCLGDLEDGLSQLAFEKTAELIRQLKLQSEQWTLRHMQNCEKSPRLFLLSNHQLKYILSNNIIKVGSSLKYFGYVCGLNVQEAQDKILELEDVGAAFGGNEAEIDNNPTSIINLGYAEGERLPIVLFKTLTEMAEELSSANVLWCNGNHTPSDIENFLHRPGAVPNCTFVVVRPDRLSLGTRRHMMHVLSGSDLKGGIVHLLFSDHEVEAAISKALRCEKSEPASGLDDMDRLVSSLFDLSPIMRNKEKQLIHCICGNVGDGKTTFIQDEMNQIRGSIPLRICVHEKFTSDFCSRLIMGHIKKHNIIRNTKPLVLHFDIADGESITNPISFFWKVMRDKEYLNRSTVRPLEELEKFVFQFFTLGFLIDDTNGEVMCLPPTIKVHGYFELPSIDILNKHLHILKGLSKVDHTVTLGRLFNVSDPKTRRPYLARDRDDDFAAYCLHLMQQNRVNVTTLYDGVRKWEASLIDNTPHMENAPDLVTVNSLIDARMKGWDRRSQRNVCSLLATRMASLARFGCFHTLQHTSTQNPGETNLDGAGFDLKKINLSSIDIAFMIDNTGSMGSYLEQAKQKVVEVMNYVTRKYPEAGDATKFACILYNDYSSDGKPPPVCKFNFGKATDLQTWLTPQAVYGGDDFPEDVAGGLEQVIGLSWSAATRCLIWIGDAPAHGKKYQAPEDHSLDSFPDGKGKDPEQSIAEIRKKGIHVHFFRINNRTDKMIDVLIPAYNLLGGNFQFHKHEIGTESSLFLEKTMSSIDNSSYKVVETNEKLSAMCPKILASAIRKFAPGDKQDERNFEQIVLGGDEKHGASCEVVQLKFPRDVESFDEYEERAPTNEKYTLFNDNVLYLRAMTPAQLRTTIAPALGLGAWSHTIVDELQRQQYALTPDFGLKLLTQSEYRDARSPVIYSGGTGVGKSEGAKLQSQLALAEGYFDVAYHARERLINLFWKKGSPDQDVFVSDIGGHDTFNRLCNGFRKACIDLGKPFSWDVIIHNQQIRPNVKTPCLLLIPKTEGGTKPLRIMGKINEIIYASSNEGFVKVEPHHNGNNVFVVKVTASREGAFELQLTVLGQSIKIPKKIVCTSTASTSVEDHQVYLDGMKIKFTDITQGLNRAVENVENITDAEKAKMKIRCARLLQSWLQTWIVEHALVHADPNRYTASERLEMIEFENSNECLEDIGKFGEKLRRPELIFKICIHPSTTIEQLRRLVGRAVYRLAHMLEWLSSKFVGGAQSMAQMRKVAVVFFDELNTSSFPGLMKQLILDRMLDNTSLIDLGKEEHTRVLEYARNGKSIDQQMSEDCFGQNKFEVINPYFFTLAADGIQFVGAINPLKKEDKSGKDSDSIEVISQLKDDAVFNVTELPDALKTVVREFGDQDDVAMRDVVFNILSNIKYMTEDERKECCRLVMLSHRLITGYRKGNNKDGTFTKNDGRKVPAIAEMENTHSSIRTVWRTVKITNFFIEHPRLLYRKDDVSEEEGDRLRKKVETDIGIEIRRKAFLTALGSTYYLQLLKIEDADVDLREEYGQRIDKTHIVGRVWRKSSALDGVPPAILPTVSFRRFMEEVINCVFAYARPLLSREQAETTVLKEHIFSILICTQLRIPVLIVGPPGCSKTLAYQLVASGFRTLGIVDDKFPKFNFKCLEESVYQCSELSSAQEIEAILKNAAAFFKRDRTHPVVLLDEASLAPRALKAIHEPFDQANVACVVLSNLQLDAAKTNRCLYLRRKGFGDELDDLKLLALSSTKISQSSTDPENQRYICILEGICKAYLKLVKGAFKSTFHLRHFLYCVRYLAPFGQSLDISPQRIAKAISRNFGGLEQQQFEERIATVFFESIKESLFAAGFRDEKSEEYTYPPKSWKYDSLEIIEESIKGTREDCGKEGFDPNIHAPRNVMLVVRGDGLGLLDMVLDKSLLNETKSITVSSFLGDDDNMGREKVISDVAREMTEGSIIRLFNGEKGRIFSAFYDAFNMRFTKVEALWYVTVTTNSRSLSREYDPRFRAIVVIDQVEYDRMRSEKSNMLPFLSRFEAHHVSPSGILHSELAIKRLRNNINPTKDHFGWIQSAVDRTFELLVQGSGCFVGISGIGQDALDTAITLVLTSTKISSDNISKKEAHQMVKIANKRLMQAARPDALCLRTKVKWLPDNMIRDYVVEQEHFSLTRYLHNTKQIYSFILMKSSLELMNLISLQQLCPNSTRIIELDRCDKADTFTELLDEYISANPPMIVITVNFSSISYDQLSHTIRLIEISNLFQNEENVIKLVVIAHLSSDRFELGQIPNAKFTSGWTTVFIDAVGKEGSIKRSDEIQDSLLHAFKLSAKNGDSEEEEEGYHSQNFGESDYINELKLACRQIRVKPALPLKGTGITEKMLGEKDALRDPINFNYSVYYDLKSSRLTKSKNEGFFLGPRTSAHKLFAFCCDKVLDKTPPHRHIEVMAEQASIKTMGGNEGESFEKVVANARNAFKNNLVCSLLVEILRDGGLLGFLTAAGGDTALKDEVAFDEDDAKVQVVVLGAALMKEEVASTMYYVRPQLQNFFPKTPFFAMILGLIQKQLKENTFNSEAIRKSVPELHRILELIANSEDMNQNFVEDLLQFRCGMSSTNDFELNVLKNYLSSSLRDTEEMSPKHLGEPKTSSIYRTIKVILHQQEFLQKCRQIIWSSALLLEFKESNDDIVARLRGLQANNIMDIIYDELYTQILKRFSQPDASSIAQSLRTVQNIVTISKADPDCKRQIRRLCSKPESMMIIILCMYVAFSSCEVIITANMLIEMSSRFSRYGGQTNRILRDMKDALEHVLKNPVKVLKSLEAVIIALLEFDKSFFQIGGNCEMVLEMIQDGSWAKTNGFAGDRELYINKMIYSHLKLAAESMAGYLSCVKSVLRGKDAVFESPFIRGDPYIANNLERSLYWLMLNETPKDLCAVEKIISSESDDRVNQIRQAATKDKLITKIAEHLLKEKNVEKFLSFTCKDCVCKGITTHKQLIRQYLFDGEIGKRYAQTFIGQLRLEMVEQLLSKPAATLEEYGLSALIEYRIDKSLINGDDYRNLMKLPFTRGGSNNPQSKMEYEEYSDLRRRVLDTIESGKANAFNDIINSLSDPKKIYRYRAYMIVLMHENGLLQRRDISGLFITDNTCKKLLIDAEERKWMEALAGNAKHYPVNPLPNIRADDKEASFSQNHKAFKSLSFTLYYLACEPTGAYGSLYIAILAAAFGAPKERNYLWHKIFNPAQIQQHNKAPLFKGYGDVDCSYDLGVKAKDVFDKIDDNNLHKCHVGSIAWGCNALSCGLMSARTPALLGVIQSYCRFSGDQRTSPGMDRELADMTIKNEFAWRNQYLHIRFAVYMELLQTNMDAPAIGPRMKAWPRDLTGAYSVNVLDRYRQKMVEDPTFPGLLPDDPTLQKYELSIVSVLKEVEESSSKIVASIKEIGEQAKRHITFFTESQERVNEIKLCNPYRYGGYDPIRRFLASKVTAGMLNGQPIGNLLDYFHRYNGAIEAMKAMRKHGSALYEIYRFCCERLSGRLCAGDRTPRYSDSALLVDVLKHFAEDESKKGNDELSAIAQRYSESLIDHYDKLCSAADATAALGCESTPRPVGAVLLAGDALGGVPKSANQTGWIVKTLVDVGKACSKVAQMAEEDNSLLWDWDEEFGIAHFKYTQPHRLLVGQVGFEIEEFEAYIGLHLPNQVTDRNISLALDGIKEISRMIIMATGASFARNIKWEESEMRLPIYWSVGEDDEDDGLDAGDLNMKARLDMLDSDGVKLALLTGAATLKFDPKLKEEKSTLSQAEEKDLRKFLESKGDDGRINAFTYCPKLIRACTNYNSKNEDENASDYIEDWPETLGFKAFCLMDIGKVCVDIMLSRNNKFSDLDVVLQSGYVKESGHIRRNMLFNIKKSEASRISMQVKRLANFLHESRVLTALAEDPKRRIRKVLSDVFPSYDFDSNLLPDDIEGSCLADYLFLLHDIASKLRLRSAKFGTLSEGRDHQEYSDVPLEPLLVEIKIDEQDNDEELPNDDDEDEFNNGFIPPIFDVNKITNNSHNNDDDEAGINSTNMEFNAIANFSMINPVSDAPSVLEDF